MLKIPKGYLRTYAGLSGQHTKFSTYNTGIGFEDLPSAPCASRRMSANNTYEYILVYVDNLLIFMPSAEQRSHILEGLKVLYDEHVATCVRMYLGV